MEKNNNLGVLKKIIEAVKSEPPKKDTLEKLTEVLTLFNQDNITEETVTELFGAVVKSFKEAVGAMEERVANGERGLLEKKQELLSMGREIMDKWQYLSSLEEKGRGMEASHSRVSQELETELARIQALHDKLKSIKASDLALEASNLAEKRIKPFIPKAEDIEGMVKENIQERERESKSTIKKLEDEIKQLRKDIATKSSGGVRRVFQPYVDDFSGSTDGSTKTFYLSREPLKSDTILVWGTDFPVILRPTTDFTVSGKTLTLTTAVPAPNSGATLLVQYHA